MDDPTQAGLDESPLDQPTRTLDHVDDAPLPKTVAEVAGSTALSPRRLANFDHHHIAGRPRAEVLRSNEDVLFLIVGVPHSNKALATVVHPQGADAVRDTLCKAPAQYRHANQDSLALQVEKGSGEFLKPVLLDLPELR